MRVFVCFSFFFSILYFSVVRTRFRGRVKLCACLPAAMATHPQPGPRAEKHRIGHERLQEASDSNSFSFHLEDAGDRTCMEKLLAYGPSTVRTYVRMHMNRSWLEISVFIVHARYNRLRGLLRKTADACACDTDGLLG